MKTKAKIKIGAYLLLLTTGSYAFRDPNFKISIAGAFITIIAVVMLINEISLIFELVAATSYNEGLEKGLSKGAISEIALFESEEKYKQADEEMKRKASVILIKDERSNLFNIVAKNRWGSKGKIISNAWRDL